MPPTMQCGPTMLEDDGQGLLVDPWQVCSQLRPRLGGGRRLLKGCCLGAKGKGESVHGGSGAGSHLPGLIKQAQREAVLRCACWPELCLLCADPRVSGLHRLELVLKLLQLCRQLPFPAQGLCQKSLLQLQGLLLVELLLPGTFRLQLLDALLLLLLDAPLRLREHLQRALELAHGLNHALCQLPLHRLLGLSPHALLLEELAEAPQALSQLVVAGRQAPPPLRLLLRQCPRQRCRLRPRAGGGSHADVGHRSVGVGAAATGHTAAPGAAAGRGAVGECLAPQLVLLLPEGRVLFLRLSEGGVPLLKRVDPPQQVVRDVHVLAPLCRVQRLPQGVQAGCSRGAAHARLQGLSPCRRDVPRSVSHRFVGQQAQGPRWHHRRAWCRLPGRAPGELGPRIQ
mmetsp:Transcript_102064/g.304602  ORF Transcript_102064/g.304602 Transcript_102064/m.304602 type:complete len:398 (-) Transcript_102064:140-1333(-)